MKKLAWFFCALAFTVTSGCNAIVQQEALPLTTATCKPSFAFKSDIVLDNDADGYADNPAVRGACVGEKQVKVFHCGSATCARVGYYDEFSHFWITTLSAKKDAAGNLIQDPAPGPSTR